MTDEELNDRFAQVADAVGRVAHAQLRFQEQLGDLAGVVRQVLARQDRHEQELAEFRQEQADFRQELVEFRQELVKFRQRQEESDQRFNILLQEIRFLIRQQQPPPEEEAQ